MSAALSSRPAFPLRSFAFLTVSALTATSAVAADTIVWSEVTAFTNTASIVKDTLPGPSSPVVIDQKKVKGANGVEFIDGRIWWPNQLRVPVGTGIFVTNQYTIGSSLPDGSDAKVVEVVRQPYDLDIQGGTLFWTDQNGGGIWKMNAAALEDGSELLLSGRTSPFAIDATADSLYWSQVGTSNRIMRSNLDGSNVTTLLTGITSYDFEVVGNQIYYATTDGFVKRSGLDGSNLVTLASGQGFLNGIDVTNDTIYMSVLEGVFNGPGFSTLGAGSIRKMNLDGTGSVEVLVAPQNYSDFGPFDPAKVRGVAVLTAPVPEPETYALMLAGIALVAGVARRRR